LIIFHFFLSRYDQEQRTPIAKNRVTYRILIKMGISEKRDKKKKRRKGVKIRMVGRFFLAFTFIMWWVKIPAGIPIKKETNNKIPKSMNSFSNF
jgi:hypothetical protein